MSTPAARAQRVLVYVARPQGFQRTHPEQIGGGLLPADILARYHRMVGNRVLMIVGGAGNGALVPREIEYGGDTPRELELRALARTEEVCQRLGIVADIYAETETAHHSQVTQTVFSQLLAQGHIFPATVEAPYCSTDGRFLPDWSLRGTCPYCADPGARGDRCAACGHALDATQLLAPQCRVCGSGASAIDIRPTERFFLDLPRSEARLIAWLEQSRSRWQASVINAALEGIKDGLKLRMITEDSDAGVPIPLEGFAGKRIARWFDALLGCYSASLAWAQHEGNPALGEQWWQDELPDRPRARSYYLIGNNEIPVYALIWPAILMGLGGLALPFEMLAQPFFASADPPATAESDAATLTPDAIERFGADALRYYLTAAVTERRPTRFALADVIRRNNDELVGVYGNLVHRVLTFTAREFGGVVPAPLALAPADRALVDATQAALVAAADAIEHVRLHDGLDQALGLARTANRFLEERAPWRTVHAARAEAATTIYSMLQVLNGLKTLFAPYLPFSSLRLHELLGFSAADLPLIWSLETVPPGQHLPTPTPLFERLQALDAVPSDQR